MPERYYAALKQEQSVAAACSQKARPYMTVAECCWLKKQVFEAKISAANFRRNVRICPR